MSSPFDAICHVEDGREFWSGRELMSLLDYTLWQNFSQAVDRAIISCQNHGENVDEHFRRDVIKTAGRPREDYHLSRYGAYLCAMNSDVRKTSVANAQAYFFVKIREAETSSTQPQPQPTPLPTTNIAPPAQPPQHREPHWFWGPMPRMSKPQEQTDDRLMMDARIAVGNAIHLLCRVAMQTRDMDLADRTEGIARWLWQIETQFLSRIKNPMF